MADRLARPPAACTALGAYLGPPLGPAAGASFEEQELLVQVELAQSVLAFGELSSQPPPARLRYDRLLRARPNDRALRYKVTKLMLATGQREAAVAAVERACRHSAHSLAEAIVRTCLLTSASLYSGSALAMGPYDASNVNPKECILPAHRGRATAHIVELTQPDQPNALPSDDGRIFRAFNPSVLFLSAAEWSDRTSAGFAADGISRACCDAEPTHGGVAGADGYVNQEDVDCRGGGTAVLSKAPNMQVRELIADLSASLLVFFRISNVRSAWSFHVLASWQRHENDEWILAGVGEDVEGSQRHERPTCSQQEWESGEMHVDSEDSHTRARGEPSRVADADDDDIQIFSWRDTELDCELRIRKANGRHRDERDGTFVDTANTLKSGGRRSLVGVVEVVSNVTRRCAESARAQDWLELSPPPSLCESCCIANRVMCRVHELFGTGIVILGMVGLLLVGIVQIVGAIKYTLLWLGSSQTVRFKRGANWQWAFHRRSQMLILVRLCRGLAMIGAAVGVLMDDCRKENCTKCGLWPFSHDGFEDARAFIHAGEVHLLANHEDCHHRRRLCLIRLQRLGSGAWIQADAWELQLSNGRLCRHSADPLLELRPVEKNWAPFVHEGELYMSYSLEPHIVLRCGWRGGLCSVAYSSSHMILRQLHLLQQDLRGGTPYAGLPDGRYLGAMHVKDLAVEPPLYGTILYIIESSPPFRVLSLSSKLCFSEQEVELALSARCALQYATGLTVNAAANAALISFGELDARMRVARLPLDAVVRLASTHQLFVDSSNGSTTSRGTRSCSQYAPSPCA